VLTAISLLLAAASLLPATVKLVGHPKMRTSAAHFGIPWPGYQLIGIAELAAAAGVIAGLRWHPLGFGRSQRDGTAPDRRQASHRRAGDSVKEAAPALVALLIAAAYLAIAVPHA
jgi:hypothetical protein